MTKNSKKAIRAYITTHPMSGETKTMLLRMAKRSELGRGRRGIEWYVNISPVAFYHWKQLIREGIIR